MPTIKINVTADKWTEFSIPSKGLISNPSAIPIKFTQQETAPTKSDDPAHYLLVGEKINYEIADPEKVFFRAEGMFAEGVIVISHQNTTS